MDGVELLLRIEEEFGIELTDAEAQGVERVGDLYSLILAKVESEESSILPGRVFYRLRRAMMRCLGLRREAVRPGTKLKAILPRPTRAAAWISLAEVSELKFPPLRHPRWARDSIRVLTGLAAVVFFVGMVEWTHPSGSFWIAPFVGAAFVAFFAMKLMYAATGFLAREFPVRTVGELAQALLAVNFIEVTGGVGTRLALGRRDVWTQLVHIISDQMGLDARVIVPEAFLGEDLGIA